MAMLLRMYFEDTKKQAESWFSDIVETARQKDVSEIITTISILINRYLYRC